MSDSLTLVQNAYAAFGRGDVPAILAMLTGGGTFESPWVHVWRVRDGKIAGLFGILDTEAAAKARAGA